jgi:TolA-binding protein
VKKSLFLISAFMSLNAQIIEQDKIDFSLNELQLASYNSTKYINYLQNKYKDNSDFDIYVEKKKFYTLYAVNIKSKNKNKVKNLLSKTFNGAYYINKEPYIKDNKIIPIVKKEERKTKKIIHIDKLPNKYDVALSFFNNKNYEVSYEIFSALFKNDLENKKINFYLARSAFELKKYDEAYSAYERILIKYPNEIRVQLEIARIYFIQKRYKNAKKIFLKIKKEKLPINVKNNIDYYLKMINNKLEKNSLNGFYMFGVGYDSNINNRANSDNFYIPKLSLIFNNTTKDKSSLNIYSALFLNHKYKFSDSTNIKNDFLIYAKKIIEDNTKNIAYLSYNPSIIKTYDNLATVYSVLADFLRYNNRYYMTSYSIMPKLIYKYSKTAQLSFEYKYNNKINKIDLNSDKDFNTNSIGIKLVNILNSKYKLSSLLNIKKERKVRGNLTNIDNDSFLYSMNLNYKYNKKLSLNTNITFENKKYKDINNLYLIKQINHEYKYNINSIYSLSNSWINKIDISHIKVESNIDSNTYKKNTLSISFMKRF